MEDDKDLDKDIYITAQLYQSILGVDLVAKGQSEDFTKAATFSSALLNSFTGGRIDKDNLSDLQWKRVERATVYQTAYLLDSGELDGQRGAGSYAGGGVSFAFSMPGEGEKVVYIDQKAIFELQQAGLYQSSFGIDPTNLKKEERKQKYVYRKWGIEAMDRSLFISDGSTKDGGQVRLAISDEYQKEIKKSKVIDKNHNHLVYVNGINNVDDWNKNALINKGYIDDAIGNYPQIRKELDAFKARMRQLYEELKIDLKNALNDEDKKISLIADAFEKLNSEMEDFKRDIKKIIEGDWQEWEKYKEEIKKVIHEEFNKIKQDIQTWKDNIKKEVNKLFNDLEIQFKQDIQSWLLKELKKPQYKGEKGEKGKDGVGDYTVDKMSWVSHYYSKPTIITYDNIKLENPFSGVYKNAVFISPLYSNRINTTNSFYGIVLGRGEGDYQYVQLGSVSWNMFGKVSTVQTIFNNSWYLKDENLGDIINQHRELQKTVSSLRQEIKSYKQQLVSLFNEVQELKIKYEERK